MLVPREFLNKMVQNQHQHPMTQMMNQTIKVALALK